MRTPFLLLASLLAPLAALPAAENPKLNLIADEGRDASTLFTDPASAKDWHDVNFRKARD
jgi:hypothetical protein